MYYPSFGGSSLALGSPRRRSSIAPPIAPVFANGSGGGIGGYRPQASSLAPDQPDSYAPPHAPQVARQGSALDPAAVGLAPPMLDQAIRGQRRINAVGNQQQYQQDRYARNRLKTEAGERGDAAGKAAYQAALIAPPAPAPALVPPPPVGSFASEAQQFNPGLASSVPSIAPPMAPRPTAPAPASPPISVAPPYSMVDNGEPVAKQRAYAGQQQRQDRQDLEGRIAGQQQVSSGPAGYSVVTPGPNGTQHVVAQQVVPGIAPPPSADVAAAELQRRQNILDSRARGINMPSANPYAPPQLPSSMTVGTPEQRGPIVSMDLHKGVENPQRQAAERAAAAARTHEQAQFDTPEQQRRENNTLAGQAIDAQAGDVATRNGLLQQKVDAEGVKAKAALDAANRPRQQTPGTQPRQPSIAELQSAAEYYENSGQKDKAAQIRQQVEGRLNLGGAGGAGSPAGSAAKPAPTEADYAETARIHGLSVDEVKKRLAAKQGQ